MPKTPSPPLADPGLRSDDGTLVSDLFGDVYFSRAGVWDEGRHVFLDGIGVPDCFAGHARFAICELGFGTGANFLLAWDAWERTAPADACLDYVAVEGFPLAAADLAGVHADSPYSEKARALAEVYPRRVPGFHRRRLAGGRVTLTLLFGEIGAVLPDLNARIDGWFLDGFAPAKNPDMWTDAVLDQIARLSAPGARLATFTAAGAVRRGLSARGFKVDKRVGFGKKRECLSARYQASAGSSDMPWFEAPLHGPSGEPVTVIGAGVAGRALASVLKDEGRAVQVVDAGSKRPGGSGVPAALVAPRITDPSAPMGQLLASCYLHAIDRLGEMQTDGVTVLNDGPEEHAKRQRFLHTLGWHEGELWQDVGNDQIYFPQAQKIFPADLLNALYPDAEIEDRLTTTPVDENGLTVLAAGPWATELVPQARLPVTGNRGQVTRVLDTEGPSDVRYPISGAGHIIPMEAGQLLLGSTYDRWETLEDQDWVHPRDEDDVLNLEKAAQKLGLAAEDLGSRMTVQPGASWAGLRATTPDHMPIVGPLLDAGAFDGRSAPWLVGRYAFTGLGSRGFQSAFLLAEFLAAVLTGAPWPLPIPVARAVHPARFIHREWKRGKA